MEDLKKDQTVLFSFARNLNVEEERSEASFLSKDESEWSHADFCEYYRDRFEFTSEEEEEEEEGSSESESDSVIDARQRETLARLPRADRELRTALWVLNEPHSQLSGDVTETCISYTDADGFPVREARSLEILERIPEGVEYYVVDNTFTINAPAYECTLDGLPKRQVFERAKLEPIVESPDYTEFFNNPQPHNTPGVKTPAPRSIWRRVSKFLRALLCCVSRKDNHEAYYARREVMYPYKPLYQYHIDTSSEEPEEEEFEESEPEWDTYGDEQYEEEPFSFKKMHHDFDEERRQEVALWEAENCTLIARPLTFDSILTIAEEYTVKSPYFREFVRNLVEYHNRDQFVELWEEFFPFDAQNPEGNELSWFVEYAFGNRAARDRFIAFWRLHSPIRNLGVEQEWRDVERPMCSASDVGSIWGEPAEGWVADEGDLAWAQSNEQPEQSELVSGEANITFVDERPSDFDSTHIGTEIMSRDVHADMAETPWSIMSVLTREIRVARGAWTSKEPSILMDLAIPKCFTDIAHSMVTSQLRLFSFLRAGAEFRIQMNGTKFHCGRLMVVLVPPMWEDDDDHYSLINHTCYPHVFLDASISNTAILTVPFVHLLSHFPLQAGLLADDSMCTLGRLRIIILNQLRVAEGGSESLYFTVFGKLMSPEVHQTRTPIEAFSFSEGIVGGGVAMAQSKEGFWKGILAKGLGAGMVTLFTGMTGGLATGIGSFLKDLIFDKPINPMMPDPIENRAVGNVCHGAGIDNSVRLGLTQIAQTETTPAIMGASSTDYDIAKLCQVPSLLDTKQWTVATEGESLLMRVHVCPTYIPNNRASNISTSAEYDMTMLAYMSRPFVYWRGDMKLKIQVIGTAFHSGRLAIVYDPTWTPFWGDATLEAHQNYNVIVMDIQEQQEMVIDVPFMSVRPWLRCDALRLDQNYRQEPKDQNTSTYMGQSTCGAVFIYVQNGLVCPDNVSQTVDVNFFWYAGENFELAVPNALDALGFSPSKVPYYEISDYPFITGSKEDPILHEDYDVENFDWIEQLYIEGRKLYARMQIVHQESTPWYLSKLAVRTYESTVWAYRVSKMTQYHKTIKGPQFKFMASFPYFHQPYPRVGPILVEQAGVLAEAQAGEEFTTTRDSAPPALCITKGARSVEVAPETLSENAMNLQTVMRRFYPMYVSATRYDVGGMVLVTIPVSPTCVPQAIFPIEASLSETLPMTNIAWFSRIFTYWRGGLRYKIVFNDFRGDCYAWHVPFECLPFKVAGGLKEVDVQKMMAFAGTVTESHLQASMEVEVPFFSPYNQLLIDVHDKYHDLRTQNGTLFVAFRPEKPMEGFGSPLSFSIFISTADDFVMNILKAPPKVYEPRKEFGECGAKPTVWTVRQVEGNKDLGDKSEKIPLPNKTGIKWLDAKGKIWPCELKVEVAEAQGLGDWVIPGLNDTLGRMNTLADLVTDMRIVERMASTFDRTDRILQECEAGNVVERVSSATGSVSDLVERVSRPTSSVAPGLTDTITNYGLFVGELAACGAVIHCMMNCLAKPTFGHFLTLAMSVAALVGFAASNAVRDLVQNIVHWAVKPSATELPQAQALDGATTDFLESNYGTVAAVVGVIGTIFYAWVFGVVPEWGKIKQSIKEFFGGEEEKAKSQGGLLGGLDLRAAHFSFMGLSALEKVYERVVELVKRFFDWLLDHENPAVITARVSLEFQGKVLQLIETIEELDYEPRMMDALKDPMIHNQYYSALDTAQKLLKESLTVKADARVVNLLTECRKRIQNVIRRYQAEVPQLRVRYDPYVVCLCGKPGTGKSRFTNTIAKIFQDVMGLSDYNLIFEKNVKDKYYSGYTQQPIMIWDEFAQNKKLDELIAEFMMIKSNIPCKVDMAAVTEKGRYFTSQGIILTTNAPFVDFNTIRDNTAFRRRRQTILDFDYAPGVDANTLQNAAHDAYPNWEHCIIRERDNITGAYKSGPLSMDQVKELVRERVSDWHAKQMAMLASEVPTLLLPRGMVPPMTEEEARECAGVEDEVDFELLHALHPGLEPVDGATLARFKRRGKKVLVANASDDESNTSEIAGGLSDNVLSIASEIDSNPGETRQRRQMHMLQAVMAKAQGGYEDVYEESDGFMAGIVSRWSLEEKAQACRNYYARTRESGIRDAAKGLFAKLKERMMKFWEEHPRIVKVGGLLLLLTTLGGLIYGLGGKQEAEGTYESGPRAAPSRRVVLAEGSYDVEQLRKILQEAEGTYESGPGHQSLKRYVAEGTYESGPKAAVKHVHSIAQGSPDPVAFEITNKVQKNMVNLQWTNGGALQGIMIGGSVLLTVRHFFRLHNEGEIFYILKRATPIAVEYSKTRIYDYEGLDWVLYDCGAQLQPQPHIYKYFIEEKNLGFASKFAAMLVASTVDGAYVHTGGEVKPVSQYEYVHGPHEAQEVFRQKGWQGNFMTKAGDCGSILIAFAPACVPPGKILGIHAAGRPSKSESFSVVITRDKLEPLFMRIGKQLGPIPRVSSVAVATYENVAQMRVVPRGDYTLYGVMPPKLTPSQPAKTSFRETPFFEEVSRDHASPRIPAALHPFVNPEGERISPLCKALNKFGEPTRPFRWRSIDKVKNFMIGYVQDRMVVHDGKRVYSEQEAILGIPGMEFADRLNMKSSPGWPYQVLEKKEPGKHYLFDDEGTVISPLLRHYLDERLEAAKMGERVPSLWRDCMKDELRPREKVEVDGKTRMFNIAPVDYTILLRRYVMDFAVAFYSACNSDFFSSVGINAESIEWTQLYNYLEEFGTQAIAGDHKQFDGKIPPDLIQLFGEIVNAWYNDSEENQMVRNVLVSEIIHTMQMCENCVYCTHRGNPSGCPVTVILNTFVNFFYFLLAWIEIYPDRTLEEFLLHVRYKAYGDDMLATVKATAKEFNQVAITEVLAKHGFVFTLDTKEMASEKFRPLNETTFLKRGFRKDLEYGKSFVLPVMCSDTLDGYFYYYKKAEDIEEQLRENMRAGLAFAAFHGRAFYDNYNRKWQQLMRSYSLKPLNISFEEQVDVFLVGAGIPVAKAEGMDTFMRMTNKRSVRFMARVLEAPVYYLAKAYGLGVQNDDSPHDDDRWAVAIPSGEGKSYLTSHYPHLFIDHDEYLLNDLKEKGITAALGSDSPWDHAVARSFDAPREDRRILLVHHPANTRRKLIGSFVTDYPTYIRSNVFQRLAIGDPVVMSRDERNDFLVRKALVLEPGLHG